MSRQLWCWKLAQGTVIVVFFLASLLSCETVDRRLTRVAITLFAPLIFVLLTLVKVKRLDLRIRKSWSMWQYESLYTWPEKCLVWKKFSWLRISGEKLLALKTSRTSHEKWCCFAFCKVFISDVPRLLDLKSIDIWWKCTKAEQFFLMYDGKSESNRW